MREQFKTDKGVAAYCGDIPEYSVLIHVSPEPAGKYQRNPDARIDVLLAQSGEPESFLGSIPLDDVVNANASRDGMAFKNGFTLSEEDCIAIENMCWDALIEDFGIVPEALVEPEQP
jgi:hypothetical protein